jgi:hypothetical protein
VVTIGVTESLIRTGTRESSSWPGDRSTSRTIAWAIKYESNYYLIELKWVADKLEPKHIGAFHYKVEGKIGARGIVIAMNGYTSGVLETLPKGKELKIILLDGNHLANVILWSLPLQNTP